MNPPPTWCTGTDLIRHFEPHNCSNHDGCVHVSRIICNWDLIVRLHREKKAHQSWRRRSRTARASPHICFQIGSASTHSAGLFEGAVVGTEAHAVYVNWQCGVNGRKVDVDNANGQFAGSLDKQSIRCPQIT